MQEREKDSQAPNKDEKLEGGREGWQMQNLANQASQKDEDEIQRETLRGDETRGDANERDVAGRVDSNETPQGREEAKNDIADKANANG